MSGKISLLPRVESANSLNNNHLVIVEARNEQGQSIETQATTLEVLYNWFNNLLGNIYLTPEDISVDDISLKLNTDSGIKISYTLPEWDETVEYEANTLVRYEGNLYATLNKTRSNPTTENWLKLSSYTSGKGINITGNEISSIGGIEVWAPNTNYAVNDFVIKDRKLFQCSTANSDIQWDKDKWINIGEGNGIITYEQGKTYLKDCIVLKDNKLYQRTANTGTDIDWTPGNWVCISNGQFANVFIRYSHTMPTSDNDMLNIPAEYMGINVSASITAPTAYTAYNWFKIRGEDGYVNVEADTAIITGTLTAEGWSNESPYTQVFNNNSLKATMAPIIGIVLSNDATNWSNEKKNFALIERAICSNDYITFYCTTKPEEDITFQVRISGDVNDESFVSQVEFNELKTMIGNVNSLLEATLGGN